MTVEHILSAPNHARYVLGWGRRGDVGFVAEESSAAVGAAWYRLFLPSEDSYGFVAPDVPELSIGVASEYRRRGIGRLLLQRLLVEARNQGYRAVSLSVEPANFALCLYESEGFEVVGGVGGAQTMVRELGPL